RIAAAGLELVDVERHRLGGLRGGGEMRQQRVVVEREVRRGDHRPPRPAARRPGLGARRGLRRRLRAPGDGHRQRPFEEELRRPPPLRRGEQDPLARRPEREHAVQPGCGQEVEVGPEGLLVQSGALFAEWRDGCRERSAQPRGATLRSAGMHALRVEQEGGLLRITMAAPERRNAFGAELIAELTEAFGAVASDVRAVLLGGDGPSFTAGADVDWMRRSIELSYEENVADARR